MPRMPYSQLQDVMKEDGDRAIMASALSSSRPLNFTQMQFVLPHLLRQFAKTLHGSLEIELDVRRLAKATLAIDLANRIQESQDGEGGFRSFPVPAPVPHRKPGWTVSTMGEDRSIAIPDAGTLHGYYSKLGRNSHGVPQSLETPLDAICLVAIIQLFEGCQIVLTNRLPLYVDVNLYTVIQTFSVPPEE